MSLSRTCTHCFATVRHGEHHACTGKPTRRYASHAERKDERGYNDLRSAPYLQARQAALQATGGRCARCARPIAAMRNGRWYIALRGSGVHHLTPRREGGTSDVGNLTPLCPKCHHLADNDLRTQDGPRVHYLDD